MQISRLTATYPVAPSDRAETAPVAVPAVLGQATEASNHKAQIAAYQELSGRWRTASDAERAVLTPALTDSAFARRAQGALNAFTRTAWAGPGAAPPAPQAQMLAAFDGLSEIDQEIVAGLHLDRSGKAAFASAAAFRDQLTADLRAAAPDAAPERPADRITLSDAARARLASGASEAWASTPSPAASSTDPETARALAAYSSA